MENGHAKIVVRTPESGALAEQSPIGSMEQVPAGLPEEVTRAQLGGLRRGEVLDEATKEASPEVAPGVPMEVTTEEVQVKPVITGVMPVLQDTGTVDDENPATAADGDKIEKVWAERIKKIVELTKSNPRQEQVEVNRLKADYLKKRFNRELGDRN